MFDSLLEDLKKERQYFEELTEFIKEMEASTDRTIREIQELRKQIREAEDGLYYPS